MGGTITEMVRARVPGTFGWPTSEQFCRYSRGVDPAWVAGLGGAVIGATASVATTWLVLRAERKRRAEEREHEERTRFHRERAQHYADFQAAAARLFAHHLSVAMSKGQYTDIRRFSELLDPVMEAEARVSYVAARPVSVAAANLLEVLAVVEGTVKIAVYDQELKTFKLEARNELGVNPPLAS